jgi:hypothetical protein
VIYARQASLEIVAEHGNVDVLRKTLDEAIAF